MNIIFQDNESVWHKDGPLDGMLHLIHTGLPVYFMVQWFCFVSLVFHGLKSNFGIMSRCNAMTDTVYQRSSDIAISEACIFLQGSNTRSVFLDFFSRIL